MPCPGIMADEKMDKSWEKARKMLDKGNASGCLELLREIDGPGEHATTLRLAGEATWANAKDKNSNAEYRRAASLLRDSVKKAPRNKGNNSTYNELLNEMQDKGIKETNIPRLINDGTPTLAGLGALIGAIIVALLILKAATYTPPTDLPTEAKMRLTWTDASGVYNDETITISLDPEAAPVHTENLHLHAAAGEYDDSPFHRIIDGFMIQGGDFERQDGTGGYAAKWFGYCNGEAMDSSADCSSETLYTIPDEADNGLLHTPCTISMAKTSPPHTGGSQFFLIPGDSTPNWLDGVHTVFGDITEGCEFVTSISEVPTNSNDNPENPVTLVSVTTNGGENTPWWYFW